MTEQRTGARDFADYWWSVLRDLNAWIASILPGLVEEDTVTEKQRTAQKIRAYCEAASDGPWVTGPEGAYWPIAKYAPDLEGVCDYQDILSSEAGNADNNADFIVNARADMLPLLEAGSNAYKALDWLYNVVQLGRTPTERELLELGRFIDDTVWLADSPEAPLSPDGEKEEGSDE